MDLVSNTGQDAAPASSALSSVPQCLKERIIRGEYLDFSDLLPDNFSHDSRTTPLNPTSDTVSSRSQRSLVSDFSDWSGAWTIFFSVLAATTLLALQSS